jgi:hypothetical protein
MANAVIHKTQIKPEILRNGNFLAPISPGEIVGTALRH